MKYHKSALLMLTFVFTFGCNPTECSKNVSIPEHFTQTSTGVTYHAAEEKKVPCDYEEETNYQESFELKNFSYEVINFNFTPDTGNHTSRLQYEIKLKNNNNFAVKGHPAVSLNVDGTVSTSYLSSCQTIDANSYCTISYDQQQSLEIGLIKSIKLESLKYILSSNQ